MARPAKISNDELSKYMRPYLVRDFAGDIEEDPEDPKPAKESMTDRLIKNDAEVAEEISKATGIKIDRNQIVYWRRKYNIRACGENHGGARYPDYASGYDLVRLLHQMDTYRLSTEWVPGLTGGSLTPRQMECCKQLRSIIRQIKKCQGKISTLQDETRKTNGCERQKAKALQIEKNQEKISALRASARKIAIENNIAMPLPAVAGEEAMEDHVFTGGKKTKGGGTVSIQAGQFFG